jgi:hypothetical protein
MEITCADAITLITGKLFCSVARLYEIFNELLSDNLYTHQLPRAARACCEPIRRELPELTEWLGAKYGVTKRTGIEAFDSGCTQFSPKWEIVLTEAKAKFGDSFEVTKLDDFEHIHPLEELTRKVGTDKIIMVEVENADDQEEHEETDWTPPRAEDQRPVE